ncbi:MAG: hypothetical protein ACYDAR_04940 [Thermomicrobiales bacterium]
MKSLRRRWWNLTLLAVTILLLGSVLVAVNAANSFANAAFQAQWAAGEALAPNFWGPLPLAHDGQTEPYVEAPGGSRLVQYFDKARMELTNPSTGIVTNGLLANELITGRLQVGDNAFQQLQPAGIPIAGDPNNVGPTYAQLGTTAASLLVATSPKIGAFITVIVGADGSVTDGGGFAGISMTPAISTYDNVTQHNVLGIFADFRAKVGLASVGLATSEPFRATVKIAGTPQAIIAQVFERRVLTYNNNNPDPFKVEFGNIGQHYYTWRYGTNTGTPATSTPTATTPAPTATPTATATTTSAAPCASPASAVFVNPPTSITRNTATTITARVLDSGGNLCGDGTAVVIADTGIVSTFAGGAKSGNGAAYVVTTVANGVATATITVAALAASGPGPVNIGVYHVRPLSDLQNGGFGIPISTEYRPAILLSKVPAAGLRNTD